MSTSITSRSFQIASEDDFWRARQLLIDLYPITGQGFCWEIRRWDGQRFHSDDAQLNPDWTRTIHLWETAAGQLIGMVHPEGGQGDAYFEIHPDYRSRIEDEMITWAEANLAAPDQTGKPRLETFVFEHDAPRQQVLAQHGFTKASDFGGVMRHLRIGEQPLPPVEIAPGYTLRETRSEQADYERMAALLNAAFNRNIHTAREYENFVLKAPCFRHDLNLVAEAPDGSFAAHVGMAYEPMNRWSIFEPVCTHPDHQRKGLARSLMFEGLHRLKAVGAQHVHVDTGSGAGQNAFYNTIGFTEAYVGYYWTKVF